MSHHQKNQATAVTENVVTHNPTLATERIQHKEEVHKQDVVTRDIEQTQVQQVTQPIHETQLNPTQRHEQMLPQVNLQQNNDRGVAPMQAPATQRLETEKQTTLQEHAPIIQERVHQNVVQEVQPVVHRDVIQPHEVLVKQPVHEHIIEQSKVTQTTLPPVASVSGLPPTQVDTTNYKPTTLTGMGQGQGMSSGQAK